MALNKMKKTVLGLVSLVATVGVLASCSTIEAKPTSSVYDEQLLALDGVTNNTMGKIYDALVTSGDTNSEKVLNNVLYLYSTTVYGNFLGTEGIKTAVEASKAGDNSKIQAIADKYSVYGGKIDKVINFYLEVLYRIRTTFYGYVTNTSYQVRSQFQEKLFYDAQVKNYYDLTGTKTSGTTTIYPYNLASKSANGSFRVAETYDETAKIKLDGKNGSKDGDVDDAYFKDIFGTYANYIELALLPDVYRSELVVQYLYKQNLGQLKLTSERKVDFISLADNKAYPDAVKNLVLAYSKNVINAGKSMDSFGFTFLGDLYKGTLDLDFPTAEQQAMATTIYSEAGWTTGTLNGGSGVTFYNESAYGTIAQNYNKLTENRFTDDSTVRSDFTGSGAYPIETGLAIKTYALLAADKTTHGWYSSSSSISSLTDTLKKRLFKIQVANDVDNNWDATTSTYSADMTMTYGLYKGNNYYLVPDTYETSNAYPYAVYDSSNWYIVKVDEAVRSSKVTEGSDQGTGSALYYDLMPKHSSDAYYGEKVARQIAYSLSSSDTWKKASNQYYVDQMALIYHDDYVYKYFKTTFPDLFD